MGSGNHPARLKHERTFCCFRRVVDRRDDGIVFIHAVFGKGDRRISAGGDPADALELKQLQEAVRSFLHTLPSRERDLFLCRYFYVESYRTIAKRFHIRETNARLILSRVRGKLRNYLMQESFEV